MEQETSTAITIKLEDKDSIIDEISSYTNNNTTSSTRSSSSALDDYTHRSSHDETAISTTFLPDYITDEELFQKKDLTTDKQLDTLNQFKSLMLNEGYLSSLTPYQKYFLFRTNQKSLMNSKNKTLTYTLIRYLRARDYHLDNANKLLKGTLQWLDDFKPYLLVSNKFKPDTTTGKIFIRGTDKSGSPLIYMYPGLQQKLDNTHQLEITIYILQSAINRMSNKYTGRLSWFVDFDGFAMKNSPSISVCKTIIDCLQNHFCERLGYCFIVNPPKVFHWFWSFLSPFIPSVTKEKVKFCWSSDLSEKRKFFEPLIDLDQLEKRYGGNSDFKFDHSAVWGEEEALDNKRIKELKEIGIDFVDR
ncbi:hypothetical protein ABK040_011066 [Willaertia magna]